MNEVRQFRLLVPPYFLALSLFAGLYFSDFKFGELRNEYTTTQLVAFGTVIGASILPVGYFITSLSILFLHVIFRFAGGQTYEATLPNETWERIWLLLRTNLQKETRWHLYACATFDHALLPQGIHNWSQRRWSTFHLSVHCFTAVAVAHLAALLPAIRETWQWLLMTVALLVVFGTTASIAWLQTMRMLEFQASSDSSVFRSPASRPPESTSDAETLD